MVEQFATGTGGSFATTPPSLVPSLPLPPQAVSIAMLTLMGTSDTRQSENAAVVGLLNGRGSLVIRFVFMRMI
jgi:hypothetical protein